MSKKQRNRIMGLTQKVKSGRKSLMEAVHVLVGRGMNYNAALNAMSRLTF